MVAATVVVVVVVAAAVAAVLWLLFNVLDILIYCVINIILMYKIEL